MSSVPSPHDLLREGFNGEIIMPADPGWAEATQAFNLLVIQNPAMVALPADEHSVTMIVDYAREQGLQIAPQRTGHNGQPLGALDDVVLVRTDRLRGVEIDAERRTARVRSGSAWGELVPAASDLGLAALHGSSPTVSIAGYTLGGGVGWYGRKHGLAANSVVAIDVVTADGRQRRVDTDSEPDLFWALRGGGGSFGIVTAIELRLFEIAEVHAGALFFPWERSAEVLQVWREWTATVPEEMTSVGRIVQIPPLPELPEFLRGQQFVIVETIFSGDVSEGDALVSPLRALEPAIDTIAVVPPAGIVELHMDPPEPVPFTGDGQMLSGLDAAAIDAVVAAAGPGSGSGLVSVEIRHLGGALSRASDDHGALGTLDCEYMSFGVGMVMAPEHYPAHRASLARLAEALAPYDTGRAYANFAEQRTDPSRFYRPEAYARLRAVRATYDPGELFRSNHPIPLVV